MIVSSGALLYLFPDYICLWRNCNPSNQSSADNKLYRQIIVRLATPSNFQQIAINRIAILRSGVASPLNPSLCHKLLSHILCMIIVDLIVIYFFWIRGQGNDHFNGRLIDENQGIPSPR